MPPGWYKIRLRILERDGYQCTHIRQDSTGGRCPEKATDVDHIIPGDDHSDDNLRSLCGYHHRIKSSSEGGSAVHKKANKPKPKHPGQV